jgi:zinc/manganese transport system substrate-binding protein
MKILTFINICFLLLLFTPAHSAEKIKVVTSLSTYADIVKQVAGDKVSVEFIVAGDQDAHYVRPKPSFAVLLNKADLFVSTGLDLEIWVPALVDMSKNNNIRSGQSGFVAAADGIELLDKPVAISRSEGDLHLYGNPHIATSPLNLKMVAENIVIGLEKIDPANSGFYRTNLGIFTGRIDREMFGEELVKLMGSNVLTKLAASGQLIDFLSEKEYKGKKMIEYLSGWLKKGLVFRTRPLVAYHKEWGYFEKVFGLNVVGYVESKPGIPPSPRHVEELVNTMRQNKVQVIFASNYYDESKIRNICEKVGATPVIVPMYVGGAPGTEDVFKLFDYWINRLAEVYGGAQ